MISSEEESLFAFFLIAKIKQRTECGAKVDKINNSRLCLKADENFLPLVGSSS
jgi:hypothetical protein